MTKVEIKTVNRNKILEEEEKVKVSAISHIGLPFKL